MVQEIDSFDAYEDLVRDVSRSPAYADPHFAFDERNLFDALNRDTDHRKAYIVTLDGSTAGLFVWLILPGEQYAEMLVGLTKEEAAIREMLAYIEERCRGFQLDFVINPDNSLFCSVLRSKDAVFDAPQQWMIWKSETKPQPYEVVQISSEYESQYLAVHRKDTYWTAEKVLAAKDTFRVFLAVHDAIDDEAHHGDAEQSYRNRHECITCCRGFGRRCCSLGVPGIVGRICPHGVPRLLDGLDDLRGEHLAAHLAVGVGYNVEVATVRRADLVVSLRDADQTICSSRLASPRMGSPAC